MAKLISDSTFHIILILPFYITLQFPFPVCYLFGDTSEIIIWNLAISLSGHCQANAKCCILGWSGLRISFSNTLLKPNIPLDSLGFLCPNFFDSANGKRRPQVVRSQKTAIILSVSEAQHKLNHLQHFYTPTRIGSNNHV